MARSLKKKQRYFLPVKELLIIKVFFKKLLGISTETREY